MLADAGIINQPVMKKQDLTIITWCCGEIQYYSSCNTCAKVLHHNSFDHTRSSECVAYPDQIYKNPGFQVRNFRPYKISSHFRAHFRQYIDEWSFDRNSNDFQELVDYIKNNINVQSPNAYILIKQYTKSIKKPRLYKQLWSALYNAGGVMPKFNSQELQRLFVEFRSIENYFNSNYDNGNYHNICSVISVLDFLLKLTGKSPYYQFPLVKNSEAKRRGDEFISGYHTFIRHQRSYGHD